MGVCDQIHIGLGGKAGHGKTSLARSLKEELEKNGLTVAITSFATVPKNMLKTMGLSDRQLYGDLKEVSSPELGDYTPRYLMQTLATEWGRQMLYDDVWVDAWENSLKSLHFADVIIVDDVRHLPEVKRLKGKFAFIFEVYRPSLMPQTRWEKLKYYLRQWVVHSSERLDFQEHGIQRLIVEEGKPDETLKKLLAFIPALQ